MDGHIEINMVWKISNWLSLSVRTEKENKLREKGYITVTKKKVDILFKTYMGFATLSIVTDIIIDDLKEINIVTHKVWNGSIDSFEYVYARSLVKTS